MAKCAISGRKDNFLGGDCGSKGELRVSPLRCAPVEMTILVGVGRRELVAGFSTVAQGRASGRNDNFGVGKTRTRAIYFPPQTVELSEMGHPVYAGVRLP